MNVCVHQIWATVDGNVPAYVEWSVTSWRRHHRHVIWSYDVAALAVVLPPGTHIADAAPLLPRAEFLALCNAAHSKLTDHQRRAVAADYLRILVMRHVLATTSSGVVAYVDADILALRPLPCPTAAEGIIFTLHPAKRAGAMAPQRRESSDVANSTLPPQNDDECFTVMDGRDHFTNALWIMRAGDVRVIDFVGRLTKPSRRYNTAMHTANDVRQEMRLGRVLPAALAHPLPWFNMAHTRHAGSAAGFWTYGTYIPSAQSILAASFAVHVYGSKWTTDTLAAPMPPTSMMAVLLSAVKNAGQTGATE